VGNVIITHKLRRALAGGGKLKEFVESLLEGRNRKIFSSGPSSLLPVC